MKSISRLIPHMGLAALLAGLSLASRSPAAERAEHPPVRHIELDVPVPPRNYTIEDTGPLTAEQQRWNRYARRQNDKLAIKDGNFLLNGRPIYLMGSPTGAAHFDLQLTWLMRLQQYDFAALEEVPARIARVYRRQGDTLAISHKYLPWYKTIMNHLVRHKLLQYVELSKSGGKDFLQRMELVRKQVKLPIHDDWFHVSNPSHGHFYAFDHHSPLGQRMYLNNWYHFMRHGAGTGTPFIGAELWNELGYGCFSELAIRAFHGYLQKKYGTVQTFNKVCHTPFQAFDDVLPPILWGIENRYVVRSDFDKHKVWSGRFKNNKISKQERYPEFFNDWVEFQRIYFADGLGTLAAKFRRLYGEPLFLTLQSRLERSSPCLYETIDLERCKEHLDFFAHQVTGTFLNNYYDEPAEPIDVQRILVKTTLQYDYARAACEKPLFNPENIATGARPAGDNTAYMLQHAAVDLHTEWKYQLDPEDQGRTEGWELPEYADASWPSVTMPNFTDNSPHPAKDFKGVVWYRKRFRLGPEVERAVDMGTAKVMLVGRGFDDRAVIYVNGRKVWTQLKWNATCRADITREVVFGEPNTVAISIRNMQGRGGLREFITIVDSDHWRRQERYTPGQLAALFWSPVIHGTSGMCWWMWRCPTKVKPEIPQIRAAIDSVSEILLPRPRIKGNVALLYPYRHFDGIPRRGDPEPDTELAHYFNYYTGLLFNQVAFDVVTCKNIIDGKLNGYRMLVAPYARMVRAGTFEQVQAFIERGGTLVLTANSLLIDDAFYRPLPVKAWTTGEQQGPWRYKKIGKGAVYFVQSDMDFGSANGLLANVLARERVPKKVTVTCDASREFPYVEAQLVGDQERFLLYLMNWGGLPHAGHVSISKDFTGGRRYTARNVRTRQPFGMGRLTTADLDAGRRMTFPVQDPQVYLFEAEGTAPTTLKAPDPARLAVLKRIHAMKDNRRPPRKRPAVLIPVGKLVDETNHQADLMTWPFVVDLLEKVGCDVCGMRPKDLTPADLKQFDMILCLVNKTVKKDVGSFNRGFWDMLRGYLEAGGSMFAVALPMVAPGHRGQYFKYVFDPYNISFPDNAMNAKPGWFFDPASCAELDPVQVTFRNIKPHPITRGVRTFQSLCATPLIDADRRLAPVVAGADTDRNFPAAPVLLAGTIGKGRIVVSGEPFFFEPFQIEQGDNLRLFWNILTWLSRDRIKDRPVSELREMLLFTEKDVLAWEAQEGF